ncbi:MAG: AAA family ATPase [Treponema sp.]|jgi:predicted AAA+ superfamily ATPase|nr:AAA family ATPase [Treponema sp.]
MLRSNLNALLEWKEKPGHKPLILNGIRQVGKTWLMKEFGRTAYKNTAYILLEKSPRLQELFSGDMDVQRILRGLELEIDGKIEPGNTLIIFDEIQECPDAIISLKYFNENAPQYDIIAAGSLLGVSLHKDISFPVGKVEFMNLYPLNFLEFLTAIGEEKQNELIKSHDWKMINIFKEKIILNLKMYFFTGGMPEVVKEFSNNRDYNLARKIQNDILNSYQNDFSKHIPAGDLQKTLLIWDSIPVQLSKENKKFIYKNAHKNATAASYETSLRWLEYCGLVSRIDRISKPALPLKGYANTGAFKLFMCDIGLLSAISGLNARTIIEGDAMFTEFKGALTEQFVCQELKHFKNSVTAYWTNESATAEIDFVLQMEGEIIPIEVKSSINLKAKSLSVYREKFKPKTEVRTSLANYNKQNNLYDIPLYAISELERIFHE